jgi:hypothetical protein
VTLPPPSPSGRNRRWLALSAGCDIQPAERCRIRHTQGLQADPPISTCGELLVDLKSRASTRSIRRHHRATGWRLRRAKIKLPALAYRCAQSLSETVNCRDDEKTPTLVREA